MNTIGTFKVYKNTHCDNNIRFRYNLFSISIISCANINSYIDFGQMELESQSRKPFPTSANQNEQVSMIENHMSGQILMQLDPWISPYRYKISFRFPTSLIN